VAVGTAASVRSSSTRPGRPGRTRPLAAVLPFARRRSVTAEIAMCKLVTSDANLASSLAAVQIFGGRGYMREDGLEKDLRAAVGAPIYSGTNEMQRIRLAAMMGLS